MVKNCKTEKLYKFILIMILSLGMALLFMTKISRAAVFTPHTNASSVILMDKNTGQIIASKNANKKLPAASDSKLLVIYLTEQAIEKGKLKHNQKIKISKSVSKFSKNTKIANEPMDSNKKYSVSELETAALLPSSNAAAMALAEKVSGSQQKYYHQAEKLLNSWGIHGTHIYSSSGLDNDMLGPFRDHRYGANARNKFSAYDLAIISRHLISKYPNVVGITNMRASEFPQTNSKSRLIKNTNKLLGKTPYHFEGLKTGRTLTRENFVGYSKLKGQPVISVILDDHPDTVFFDAERLMAEADQKSQLTSKDSDYFTKKDLKVNKVKESVNDDYKKIPSPIKNGLDFASKTLN